MAAPAHKLPTYDDLLALGDDIRVEIIAGEIVLHASPGTEHGAMMAGTLADIYAPFHRGRGGPGGWWILTEVDLALPDGQIYRPDILGWRRERGPELSEDLPCKVRPDWVCEILSTSNRWYDRGPKREGYHRWGVPHYWMGDPTERTLTVLTWGEAGYVITATAREGERVRVPPFEAVELDLGAILLPKPNR